MIGLFLVATFIPAWLNATTPRYQPLLPPPPPPMSLVPEPPPLPPDFVPSVPPPLEEAPALMPDLPEMPPVPPMPPPDLAETLPRK